MRVARRVEVEAALGHFVACIVASRALSFAFWFYGYQALKPRKRDGARGSGGEWVQGCLQCVWLVMPRAALVGRCVYIYIYISCCVAGRAPVVADI